ncbi:MAG TPA: SRPBCC domain-containing protein [Natronosporangium sp.]
MSTTTTETTQVYRVYIRAMPQAIWDAITKPEWTERYGYPSRAEWDPELRAGATYRAVATEEMRKAGLPEVAVIGEVIEADPPRKLVLTWQAQWEPVEEATRLTYEIEAGEGGVSKLTVIHELAGAPGLARMLSGELESTGAGGGWTQVLSDLKTLLETGNGLYGS